MSNRDQNCANMERHDRNPANLPMVIATRRPRPSLFRHQVPAHFLSQLIAEKNHMPVQRPKKRVPVNVAAVAYSASIKIAHPSMPAGYGHAETV